MSKSARGGANRGGGVVIKKEEVVEGGGHGGAWKVAYADFVTAMMAFFLLMWLLNATTEDQRKGLADYFSPNSLLSHASSGTGDPFGGHTAFDNGALVSDRGAVQALVGSRPTSLEALDAEAHPDSSEHLPADDDQGAGPGQSSAAPPGPPPASAAVTVAARLPGFDTASTPTPASGAAAPLPPALAASSTPDAQAPAPAPNEAELRAAREQEERAEFDHAAQQIRDAVGGDPALAELARQLMIDMTPDGLRIQILDADQRPMFALGSATPNERARLLLEKITPVLRHLPEAISIAGHTDAAPFPGPERTNWELSAERANATRRLLIEEGMPENRIRSVTGNADRDLLLPKDPLAAANRRIAIVVLRGARESGVAGPPAAANATGGNAAGGNAAGGNAAGGNAAGPPPR